MLSTIIRHSCSVQSNYRALWFNPYMWPSGQKGTILVIPSGSSFYHTLLIFNDFHNAYEKCCWKTDGV
ncbi:unnamed protein product [Thlaspi arvense]|uniref:Uncharacterized protein n=1 Tax=Thlaspi arvense TaxID=13288 RepID=A0AAU9SFS6_THLAR|nr:unnamed protein product [Thlaspi arvense]